MSVSKVSEPIKQKTVKRWYFDGKGYSTKKLAYRAKAKRLLRELVLGPVVIHDDDFGHEWWAFENATPPEGMDHKQFFDERFAMFFPHDNSETAVQPGCLHDPSAYACRRDYHGDYDVFNDRDAEWDFKFKSCKHSQNQWLDRKVAELMAADLAIATAEKEQAEGGGK